MNLNPEEGIAVFTDGSAHYKDRIGGWGWVAIDVLDGIHLASGGVEDCTNNQMELYAAINALQTIFEHYGAIDVLVVSDSEYVVLGCQDPSRARKVNVDYWSELDDAIDLHNYVEFEHIKGHAGHTYNEMADRLAHTARKEKTSGNSNSSKDDSQAEGL